MNNPSVDKAEGEKEKIQAKIDELKAQLKIAAADARMSIEHTIKELEAKIRSRI